MASPNDSGLEDEVDQVECTCLDRIIKPLTKQNIIHHYIPLGGGACYTAMAAHITNPNILKRFVSSDPINILLSSSLGGTTLYIYHRKHLRSLPGKERIIYSFFSAGLFNLGSILAWAMIRSATLSRSTAVQASRAMAAVGVSILLLKTGMDYFSVIDGQIKSKRASN